MQHRSLIRRINDFLVTAQPSDKINPDPGSMVEQIMKEFNDDEDFNHRIVSVVSRFSAEGLDTAAYLKAALRQPTLFYQSPETVEAHIRGVGARFAAEGLDVATYLKAALKQPSLFCQSPETIESNIRGLITRFAAEGLDVATYLKTAMKQPVLFYQSPETIAQHITIIRDIYASGCCQAPQGSIWKFLCSRPFILTLSSANLHLREHLALHQGLTGAKALSMGTLFDAKLYKLQETVRRVVPKNHPTWLLVDKEPRKR